MAANIKYGWINKDIEKDAFFERLTEWKNIFTDVSNLQNITIQGTEDSFTLIENNFSIFYEKRDNPIIQPKERLPFGEGYNLSESFFLECLNGEGVLTSIKSNFIFIKYESKNNNSFFDFKQKIDEGITTLFLYKDSNPSIPHREASIQKVISLECFLKALDNNAYKAYSVFIEEVKKFLRND